MPVLVLGGVGLVVFVVALFCLLMLVAGRVPLKILHDTLSHVWLVGGSIAGVIDHWTNAVMTALDAALDAAVAPVAHWLWGLTVGLWHLVYQLVATVADAKQWAVNAYDRALAATAAAEAYAAHQVANLAARLNADMASVERGLAADVARAEAYAAAGTAAAEALAHSLAGQVSSEAVRLFGQAEAVTARDLAQAEAFAAAQADAVASEAVRLFGQAETGIRALQGQVAGIPAEISGEINRVLPADIAQALAAAGVAGLAGLAAQVGALTTQADTCLEPLCDTVTPNSSQLGRLGQIIKDLETLAEAGALAGLLSAAVADPAAAAAAVNDTMGWVTPLGAELARAVGAAV